MREIWWDQGLARACYHDGFHDLGTSGMVPWTSQSSGVRADAQCCKITWLDELVSESNTIQVQEDITQAGLKAGQDQRKLCMKKVWFFIDIFGLLCSFGIASSVVQE